MQTRQPIFYALLICAAIEVLLFLALCSLPTEVVRTLVWSPDTTEYNRVALHFAETFTFTSTYRTLGYPMFLSLGYLIAGRDSGPYVAIGLQLVLNIVFTWGYWRLLERIVPTARVRYRLAVTLFFFWAGLGMALFLLTDFLASFFFGVFVYAMLFWRSPFTAFVSGVSLALATLTRPTFTFIPFLLPIAAYLIGRITFKVPWYAIAACIAFSFAATGFSVMRQYMSYAYLGPSPHILVQNIEATLYHSLAERQEPATDAASYAKRFETEVGKRAGQQYASLSLTDQERYAKQIFLEYLVSHPRAIITRVLINFFKYLFVPIEVTIQRGTFLFAGEKIYFTYVRPLIGLVCLPIWILSLVPPVGSPEKYRMFYVLMMLFVLYVIGISAITDSAGERMRFSVLPLMLSVAVWNIHCLDRNVRARVNPVSTIVTN